MTEIMIAQAPPIPTVAFPQNRHGRPPRGLSKPGVNRTGAQDHSGRLVSCASLERTTSMPVSAGSPVNPTFPSFMSVFGNGTTTDANLHANCPPLRSPNTERKIYSSNYTSLRRDSSSTFESTESSPTTTVSTVASSLTEPSPNSSPESPNTRSKVNSIYLRRESNHQQGGMERREQFSSSFPILPGIDKPDSPQKKMRNMKNLSVNTVASNRPAAAQLPKLGINTPSFPPPNHASSAPPTPAFIVPPKPPRRKPSNLGLSITTPESSASGAPERPSAIPQTPSDTQISTLRRLQTSMNGPLQSPTVAPEGGMRLPPFSVPMSSSHFNKAAPPLSISPGAVSSPIRKQTLEHVQEEPDYELPLSREAKSPAYPQGPVCIYDPYVYLYLEPTKVEASEFDVILNVAKEVPNPFDIKAVSTASKMVDKGVQVSFDMIDKGVQASFDDTSSCFRSESSAAEPQPAPSHVLPLNHVEAKSQTDDISGPSTPRPLATEPEYIHVPWDHNTNVVEDLLKLCETIEDRVRRRKRVLIHCQCGVSRSASLVVAYGMYRNPQLTVQEAYDAVKHRSKWIGPNMNLIYQLSEFKGMLAKRSTHADQNWQSWRKTVQNDSEKDDPLESSKHRDSPEPSSNSNRLSMSAPTPSFLGPESAKLPLRSSSEDTSQGPLSAPAQYDTSISKPLSVHDGHDKKVVKPLTIDTSHNIDPPNASMQIFSPTVQETQPAPLGAVANDLRAVAQNLDSSMATDVAKNPVPRGGSSPEASEAALPGSWPTGASESPLLTSKPSISKLKMGFSRLFSRQQTAVPLPIRQAASKDEPAQNKRKSVFIDDVPPTPSLLSPRAAEFTASPFHRTVAGDLAGSSSFEQALASPRTVENDPRSPAQAGEAPITRSIFDVL